MARLIVSPQDDIAEILAHLRQEAEPAIAGRYLDDLEKATDLLVQFPGVGSPRPELGAVARITMVPPYLLIYDYRPSEDIVALLRVVHGRRNITIDLIHR